MWNVPETFTQTLLQLRDLTNILLEGGVLGKAIQEASIFCIRALAEGHKIIACGNGGSMAQAIHLAEELTGRYRSPRKALPALAISDPGHLSCVANDFGFSEVFARFVEAHGNPGDVLVLFTTSGNSPNIIRAAEVARGLSVATVGFTGGKGGALRPLLDCEVCVEATDHSARIQEIHLLCIHWLIEEIERNLT
ncbi:MAG: SIS domain-containing protein [Flavobacteriales bacterium]|nr:SIS domain-containing protein [Flavobacteriales bacterium]MCX7769304.1 SIS domain-containing protein [Flavobacteriales bacterium]MDW8410494.1 SIS domain-containing protein [Flavobacteriales bacterium]